MSKQAWAMVSLAILTAACETTPEGPARLAASANFCADKATAECQAAVNCGNPAAACKTQRTQACLDHVTTATAAGRKYSQDLAQGCLDKTKSLYAKTTPIAPADFALVDDTCERVLQGSIAVNQTCTKGDYECSGKLVCDKGFCGAPVVKKAAEPCGNPGETCATGSYCAPSQSLSICKPRNAKGAKCSNSDKAIGPCLEDFRCTSGLLESTCTDRVAAGGACTPGADECAVSVPYCDVGAKKCFSGAIFAPSATELCKSYGG